MCEPGSSSTEARQVAKLSVAFAISQYSMQSLVPARVQLTLGMTDCSCEVRPAVESCINPRPCAPVSVALDPSASTKVDDIVLVGVAKGALLT